jgi:hypothetical protein
MSYRIINSGKNQRREYIGANRSPLFKDLPDKDYAQEQRKAYDNFIFGSYNEKGKLLKPSRLSQLFEFYFPQETPIKFSDYNNQIQIRVENLVCEEPAITEEQARIDFHT